MKHKKITILAASLLAAALTTTGVTLAFLAAKTEEVVNTFTPSEVKIEVDEPGWETNKYKQDVTIQNTGDTTAYIRAAVVKNWLDAESENIVYLETDPEYEQKTSGVYFTLEEGGKNNNWYYHTDGYYYYLKPVDPTEKTSVLIDLWKVTYPENPKYILQVDVLAQSVQSTPVENNVVTAAQDLWGVTLTVANDGTITKIN